MKSEIMKGSYVVGKVLFAVVFSAVLLQLSYAEEITPDLMKAITFGNGLLNATAAIGDGDLPQGDLNIDAEDPVIALPVEGESSWTAVKGIDARESEERNITVTVSEPAGVVIDVADGQTYEYTEDDGEHGGGAVEIRITLTEKNQTGKPLYAFLAPATDHGRNAVDCAL